LSSRRFSVKLWVLLDPTLEKGSTGAGMLGTFAEFPLRHPRSTTKPHSKADDWASMRWIISKHEG